MKLFLILGNQLFSPKYLKKYSEHLFYMSEDFGLCTFQNHHKLKILLFLSSMRSFRDELKTKKFKWETCGSNWPIKLKWKTNYAITFKRKLYCNHYPFKNKRFKRGMP